MITKNPSHLLYGAATSGRFVARMEVVCAATAGGSVVAARARASQRRVQSLPDC